MGRGDGPETPALQARGVDGVTWLGSVSEAEKASRLRGATLACFPSIEGESFGIVLLEAMAREVAVMAVDSGGPSEFVENDVTGMLARSGSPADLADALAPLLADPERRAAMAAAGRRSYLTSYTDAALRERFFARMQSIAAGS